MFVSTPFGQIKIPASGGGVFSGIQTDGVFLRQCRGIGNPRIEQTGFAHAGLANEDRDFALQGRP